MAEPFSTLLGLVRVATPRVAVALAVASGFVLFGGEWIETAGLKSLRERYAEEFGITFVVSVAFLCAYALFAIGAGAQGLWRRHRRERQRRESLHALTADEKAYLVRYIEEGATTQLFAPEDGIAGGLQAKQIIYRSSNIFDMTDGVPYNLQPWARTCLSLHPELLEDAAKLPPSPRRRRSGW
ncbi:MAG: superinfection exclusion B family protein [Enhydrobacter sp.]|nr:MAG: superinfection exclusion B family protein [Enhydrobacter sp.]